MLAQKKVGVGLLMARRGGQPAHVLLLPQVGQLAIDHVESINVCTGGRA